MEDFWAKGWKIFPATPEIERWIAVAREAIPALLERNEADFRYGGTWFPGIHALPNDEKGALPGGPIFTGPALDFLKEYLGPALPPFDRGQVSICFPGYPQRMTGESEAAFAFRRNRDAAHIDGIHGIGPDKRRFLREPHAFLLGIPLEAIGRGTANFTIWEGSHHEMGALFREHLGHRESEIWPEIDLTEAYRERRARIFEKCRRLEFESRAGEIYLTHRHALHGMAPWPIELPMGEPTSRPLAPRSPSRMRAIIYFRPLFADRKDWLTQP